MTHDRERQIVAVLVTLSEGEVTTYGDVAADAGYPRHARLVGRLLSTTKVEVPWWRVVNSSGRLVPGNEVEHGKLLRSEGVTIRDSRVVDAPTGRFSKCGNAARPQ